MRDLGQMGENSLQLWCSQVGLTANGSRIDRTGWDFVVEFPFHHVSGPTRVHEAAIECKVQVKATDNRDRKWQIKLSNLRRLITAPMPAFILILEFDGKKDVQRAFLVHIDEELISRTLERIHELETVQKVSNHHKRTLTIQYGDQHAVPALDGEGLKSKIESHVPEGLNSYVAWKNNHLKTTGFENGFAQITFQTDSKEDLLGLIDVSLGLKRSVRVTQFRESKLRFGIKSDPQLLSEFGDIEMPNLKPTAVGSINFRESPLSAGLTFRCKFYSSPLNRMLPRHLVKLRIEADCFDISTNPYSGSAEYRFNAGAGVRLPINQLHDALSLMRMVTSSARKVDVRLDLSDGKELAFALDASDKPFEHTKILETLSAAVNICHTFQLSERPLATLEEIGRDSRSILQFWTIVGPNPSRYECSFTVAGTGFVENKATAVVGLTTTRIGKQLFGAIFVCTGMASLGLDGRYSLLTPNLKVERMLISSLDEMMRKEDLVQAIEDVEEIYRKDHQVLCDFDKRDGQ
ncbi:hypothetical protein [Achromobacter sp.]|uniref:hypothetical protein n=1 Tax=Achromobacter sp. TaxID=134375 RepID=UPI0028A90EE3|nr:hypothetical protein [Achromobacter sp.]